MKQVLLSRRIEPLGMVPGDVPKANSCGRDYRLHDFLIVPIKTEEQNCGVASLHRFIHISRKPEVAEIRDDPLC
jgi:hypothetical protein